jgi:hypothetical protein
LSGFAHVVTVPDGPSPGCGEPSRLTLKIERVADPGAERAAHDRSLGDPDLAASSGGSQQAASSRSTQPPMAVLWPMPLPA